MIDSYAHALAVAQQTALDTAHSAAQAQAKAVLLQSRLTAKQTALAAIQHRRLTGTEADTDAAEIVALTLDCDGLAPLLAQARQDAQAAQATAQAATNAVSQAQTAWQRAVAQADAAALEARLRELEVVFAHGLRRLASLKANAHGTLATGQALYRLGDPLDRFFRLGVTP